MAKQIYVSIEWRMNMKNKNIKNRLAVFWYAPCVWFSELCNELSEEQKRAEKVIRFLMSSTIILFFISALSIITLIYIWILLF